MPTEAATDEFNALFAQSNITDRHPEDAIDTDRNSDRASDTHRSDNEESQNNTKGTAIRGTGTHSQDSDSDSHQTSTAHTHRNGKMRSRYFIPSLRSEANTGPKGVIADAQAYEEAKRAHRSSFFSRAGFSRSAREASAAQQQQQQQATTYTIPAAYSTEDYQDRSSLSAEEASDDEEGFLARWRQGRLRELAGRHAGSSEKRRVSPSNNRRVWGSLITVDAEGYLDAIEKVGRDVVVCVLIYDDQSEISQMVEDCVATLARQHQTTRFVKLHYEEAEMEIAGVPALLAYRGGDKFAGLVPVVDEIPDDQELNAQNLGEVLKRHQILFDVPQ